MPIYEYKCPKCGQFEVMQKFSDPLLDTCPKCGQPVRKLIGHGVGIIFKGPGFYVTDNRPASYKEKEKEEQGKADTKAADS